MKKNSVALRPEVQKGIDEVLAFKAGRAHSLTAFDVPVEAPMVDVKALRQRLGLTRSEFSKNYGLSKSTVENWEREHRMPDQPARILLQLIATAPDFVARTLQSKLVAR